MHCVHATCFNRLLYEYAIMPNAREITEGFTRKPGNVGVKPLQISDYA